MRQVTKKGLITAAAASGVLAAVTGSYAQASSGASGHSVNSPGVASGNTIQAPVHVPVNACGNTVNVVGLLNPASGNHCVNGGGHHGGGHGGGNHGNGGSGAHGAAADSPGVLSGNTVQAPVDVPVNACGNSVNVVGVGNHTTGNDCANVSQGGHEWPGHPGHKPPHKPGDHDGAHKPPSHPGHPGGHDCDHKPPAKDHDKPAGHKPGDHTPGQDKPGEHAPAGHKPARTDAAHIPAPAVKDAHKGAPMAAPAMATGPAAKAVELAHTGAGQLGMAGAASAGLLLGGAVIYRRARAGQN
ncbi:chaplin family protein [Streptomyces klenkii]